MKKYIIVIFLLIFLISPNLGLAEISVNTVNYLKGQPQTAWTIMALRAVDQSADLSVLQNSQLQSATDYEKIILAVVAGDGNSENFYGQNLVKDFKDKFYQENQLGDSKLLNDDFWGILALRAAGESVESQIIQDSQNFILKHQNTDGGWGFSAGSSNSDTNDTAVAVMALLESGLSPNNSVIAKAVNYLVSTQNNDGGWGFILGSVSDTASTSWVVGAINKLGQDPRAWIKNNYDPIEFIESLKLSDGSFVNKSGEKIGSSLITSYAIIALAGKSYPIKKITVPVKPTKKTEVKQKKENKKADNKPPEPERVESIPQQSYSVYNQTNKEQRVKTVWDIINFDSDNDGLNDEDEKYYNTNPLNPDTDGDGYLDGEEVEHNYDPLGPAPCPIKKYSSSGRIFAYGQKRLSSLNQEQCRAGYLKRELASREVKAGRQYWIILVNAFTYGNYSVDDIVGLIQGEKTIHPFITKSAWQKTWQNK